LSFENLCFANRLVRKDNQKPLIHHIIQMIIFANDVI